tara:strand:- start:384 stop:497 length:114 start_codon:yes stop_codon:yes gene_type:complete
MDDKPIEKATGKFKNNSIKKNINKTASINFLSHLKFS